MTEFKKQVDESWKDSVEQEKEILITPQAAKPADGKIIGVDPDPEPASETPPQPTQESAEYFEVNFYNYVASLAFQAMVFLGEIPNPMSNQTEKNLPQAKFLIDTLILIREKTKGNLTKEEDDLLNGSIYELQVKFVENTQKGSAQ